MPDEEKDIHETPGEEGREPGTEKGGEGGQEDQETQEDKLVKRIVQEVTQNVRSFDGRKIAEVKKEIVSEVTEFLKPFRVAGQEQRDDEGQDDLGVRLYEKPRSTFREIYEEIKKEEQDSIRKFIGAVGNVIKADPFLSDPENLEVGKEIVAELQSIAPTPGLDPETQARMVVLEAKNRVLSRRIGGKKSTPFDDRGPTDKKLGGAPPDNGDVKKKKSVKISDEIVQKAFKLGYKSVEEMEEVLGDLEEE